MLKILPGKFIIPLLFIPLILITIWFGNGFIHGGGDAGIDFYNAEKNLQLSTTVWIEYATGLTTVSWLSKVPIAYLFLLFEKIGLPPFIFQATISYLLMVLSVISIYFFTLILVDQYRFRNLISFVSALFYLFNPYTFSQVWARGLQTQQFAFALLPLTLLLYILAIKRKKYLYGVFIALISALFAAAYGFLTFILVYWFVLNIYFLYKIVISENKAGDFSFGIKFTFFFFLLWCLFNFWWLLPILTSFGNVYSGGIAGAEHNLGSLIGVSRNFTPDIIIRLLQRTYFFDPSAFSLIYSTFIFQLISFIPIFFVLIGLIKTLRDKELKEFRFFALLFILGLVVSSGANPPFGWLFVWLFKHISVLQAFRNPFEKFGLVYVLGYIPLFALGLIYFFSKIKFKWLGIITILVLSCGIFAWPMWTGRVIAGPDKKIGLDIPAYYQDLRNFLKDQGGDFRLLMTPIWSGDGAFYQWGGGGRYQGSDPMVFMFDQSVISNGARGPYFYDFITNIRKYMERINVAPSLSLLRIKFLIDRKDSIMITDKEKDHYKYLTSSIFLPQLEGNLKTICANTLADNKTSGIAWIVCQIPQEHSDFTSIRYLHLKIKTDVSASLEVALRDINGIRIRWDGRVDPDYHTDTNDWKYITVPLSAPTEHNNAIDFSKSFLLEIFAHPKDAPEKSAGEINLAEIKLDPGLGRKTDEFRKVGDFGKLTVFEATQFNAPPEFGTLSSTHEVSDFVSLFEELDEQSSSTNKKRNPAGKTAFVLTSQNTEKNLRSIPNTAELQIVDKSKISNTRYWLKVNEASGGGLLLLSKTFNSEWKVIPGITKEKLSGNLFDDLNLLKMSTLSEDNHFVVNGYANLWKIDGPPASLPAGTAGRAGEDREYAIIFKPQIIADIAIKVSIFSILFVTGFSAAGWVIKRKANHQ